MAARFHDIMEMLEIEIEKEYDLGRPKVNKPRIDIIVRDKNKNIFLYIECKKPSEFTKDQDEIIEKQLYNLASQEIGEGKKIKYLVSGITKCNRQKQKMVT